MINDLNEKPSNRIIVASVIAALVVLVGGLIAGFVLAVRSHERTSPDPAPQPPAPTVRFDVPHFVFTDSVAGLRSCASALRLADSPESAEKTLNTALVFATRAETALECEGGEWSDCRAKEAFLNDASSLLSAADGTAAIEKAEVLYEFSTKLYDSLGGGTFEYNGELSDASERTQTEQSNEQSDADYTQFVVGALNLTDASLAGEYDGIKEYFVSRGDRQGYAVVAEGKIKEFSFEHYGDAGEVGDAVSTAISTAEACGYDELQAYSFENTAGGIEVKMCCKCCGALCRDECATAFVMGDEVVAFSAGNCGKHHELPKAVYTEEAARSAAPAGGGAGVLVTTFDGVRDRICYEYRYELEDGTHYVYVCAENGRQMTVR